MLSKLPPTKTENIVVQSLERELLIYNLVTNKAFCLNETSAIVYQNCDGKTSFEQFKTKYQFSDDLIFFALDELSKQDLIEKSYESPLKGMKRREVIKKIGLATVVALPVITSLIAPTAIQAAISCGGVNAPGPLTCTMGIPGCEVNIAATCASCSAMTITPSINCPNPNFAFECVCD